MERYDVANVQMRRTEILPLLVRRNIQPETADPEIPISETAAFERTGLSGDMQKFLSLRNFDFFGGAEGETTPPSTEPPTYPNAPLFSQGAGDANSVDYDDVAQGQQNNCFLMASIAAVAKTDPQAIHDMVEENRDASGNVTSYTVTLYDDGDPVEVEVAPSELLADGANPESADNGEVWVAVIEAAYAELNGGTDVWDEGGTRSTALETLTGRESDVHDVDGDDYSFDDLQSDLEDGRAVTIGTLSGEDDEKGKVAGSGYELHNWHGYVVESVYVDENGTQMVELHNPWGYDHPKPAPFNELESFFTQFAVN